MVPAWVIGGAALAAVAYGAKKYCDERCASRVERKPAPWEVQEEEETASGDDSGDTPPIAATDMNAAGQGAGAPKE